jgi:hypothetical protein
MLNEPFDYLDKLKLEESSIDKNLLEINGVLAIVNETII